VSLAPSLAPPARLAALRLDPVTDSRWTALIEQSSDGCVFHHPAWLELLRAQYGHEVSTCCIAAPDGRLVAGLPIAAVESRLTGRRLVALPFSDLCPPVLAPDAPAGSAAALAGALDALRRQRGLSLEIRGGREALHGAQPGARFHHHVLALEPDVTAVQRRFRKPQVMRGVRRALRDGLVAERRTDAAALAAFYRLHVDTRARLGAPTQPRRFVLRFAALFAERLGFVLLVRSGGRPVAAAVFMTFGDVLTYKYGASDARHLGSRPNNLLFMEAIRWGCEHGMRALDLGRTDWGHESLRAFKLAWGPEERELRYWHLGGNARDGRGSSLNRAAEAVLRRGSPLASRLVGEVLYRHAA
jgi:CelD/BcsL family acetyltransferase involved in cellulose biosynthesis